MTDIVTGSNGCHLIDGQWITGPGTFQSAPWIGAPREFAVGSASLVDRAAQAAETAFADFAATSREDRAAFLDRIADEITARGTAVVAIAHAETWLPVKRLESELARTTGQLRLFSDHIRDGAYLDRRFDPALPDRRPLPRPDLRMMQMSVGPVAVFGASNFPLAFSVAGGDTASALAAGCPVVHRAHSAHPGTAQIVAEAVLAAIGATNMPIGCFALLQGGERAVGAALVTHPAIRAVGFTGSLAGGRALFDLCAARPDPIPFFGELGSVNPIFLLPHALAARAEAIGRSWVASLTLGAGQFCTKPGLAIAIEGPHADLFASTAANALAEVAPQVMLTDGMAQAFREAAAGMAGTAGVLPVHVTTPTGRNAEPFLFQTAGDDFLSQPELAHEVFGPLGLFIRARDAEQLLRIAAAMEGQLTASLHIDKEDYAFAARLAPILARTVGRLLANGFPTGVEVSDAMVHGGPWPASTNFGATSVGTMSIRRWLRPVCWQDWPEALLPPDIRKA